MPDDKDTKNPFVKFKQHVDAHISSGLQSLLGLPSLVTQNLNLDDGPKDENTTKDHSTALTTATRETVSSPSRPLPPGFFPISSTGTGDNSSGMGSLDPSAARVEATLVHLSSGCLFEEHLFAWNLFLSRSAYSPLKLDVTLPPPAPRDLSRDVGAAATWSDAFEDLLATNTGQPLKDAKEFERELRGRGVGGRACRFPPHHNRHSLGGTWNGGVGGWGGPGLDHGGFGGLFTPGLDLFGVLGRNRLLPRLLVKGLTEAYFPLDDPALGYASPRTKEDWAARWQEFEKARKMLGPAADRGRPWEVPGQVLKDMDRVFERIVDDISASVDKRVEGWKDKWDEHMEKKKSGHVEAKEDTPVWTEEDLYLKNQLPPSDPDSSAEDTDSSWLNTKWSSTTSSTRTENNRSTTRSVSRDRSGKTVTTSEEFVDEDGTVHVRTQVRKTDARGREVMNEETHAIRPTGDRFGAIVLRGEEAKTEAKKWTKMDEEAKKNKKDGGSGWFW